MTDAKTLIKVQLAVACDMSGLTYLIDTVREIGHANPRDLNRLAEIGVPMMRELQVLHNCSASDVMLMAEAGEISYEQIDKCLKVMTAATGILNINAGQHAKA